MYTLEVCVDSVESAIAAERGGASRFELCGHLITGGVTPSYELFLKIREVTHTPVNVLIRPRFGDFCYSEYEYEIIKREILWFKEHGASAAVIGVLKEDGDLDVERMKELIALARPMKVTLHRAFDVCRDAKKTLQEAMELGVDTILTSGQESSALKGAALLRELTEIAGDRLEILVGAGVSDQNLPELIEKTGAKSFHLSGKTVLESRMKFRREGVPMGLPGISEFEIWQTDENTIKSCCQILKDSL